MPTGFVRESVVEYGRRKGSSKQVGSWEIEKPEADLPQVVVLSKSEWQRVQDSVNSVDHQSRSVIAAADQREALHTRSTEAVAHWSNTNAGQRRQKLEARAVREAMAEEKRKQLDLEEAEHQAQRREEIIERAQTQQFYQTNRVKGFHSALMLTEVQKEREAQVELKRLKLNASRDADREFFAERARREEQAVQRDQQNALRRKRDRLAVSESWTLQCQDHERKREQKRQEIRREAEELERLRDRDLREQAMKERKKQEEKRRSTNAFQELLTERELKKAAEARRQEEEEEKRKQIASQKQEQKRVWKEKQEGILRERQRPRDTVMQKLAVLKQEDISNEEESIAKAVAEREAKRARVKREKEEKRAAMLESIAAHRESKRRELERKAEEEKQKSLETLNALKEADQLSREKQQHQAQKAKEERTALQDLYIQERAEKRARALRTRKEQKDFVAKNIALFVEEENQFQKYAKQVIEAAEKAERDVSPLLKDQRQVRGNGENAQVFFS